MPTTPFTLGNQTLIHLPSYRWLSIIPFTIDTAAVPSDPEALFATLRGLADCVVALDRGRVTGTGAPALALFDAWAGETG